MGLFGKKKTVDLADNEYYFPMNFFRYVLEDNALIIKDVNKKGKVVGEKSIPYKKITKLEKIRFGGNQYSINIFIDDDKNKKPEFSITYNDKKNGEQADRFHSILQSKLY